MRALLLLLVSTVAFAHDHGGGSASIGKGKGVESYDEHEGFKLADAAIKRLGVVATNIGAQKECNLKSAQVVSALDKKIIYIKRGDNFKSFPAKCEEVKTGDLVVTKGAEFLRVVEMDLGAGEEEGDEHEDEHGHNEESSEAGHQHGKEEHHD